jgi:hypothetical protein
MKGQIQKIRNIAHDIEVIDAVIQNKKASFKDLYSYLDSLQNVESRSDSSDEEIDMQKYIAPVRTMLGRYKQSIKNIKETQRLLSRSTDASEKENILCERVDKKKNKNYK